MKMNKKTILMAVSLALVATPAPAQILSTLIGTAIVGAVGGATAGVAYNATTGGGGKNANIANYPVIQAPPEPSIEQKNADRDRKNAESKRKSTILNDRVANTTPLNFVYYCNTVIPEFAEYTWRNNCGRDNDFWSGYDGEYDSSWLDIIPIDDSPMINSVSNNSRASSCSYVHALSNLKQYANKSCVNHYTLKLNGGDAQEYTGTDKENFDEELFSAVGWGFVWFTIILFFVCVFGLIWCMCSLGDSGRRRY